ncbi:uncharacterized protein LOC124448341 [Xenia sp. Carnegie-2017]|uniref:uncharacterized protein LOC124448341 n=1 Tax=Xenia sp. Carnegie-2017 TaxID=2897299 RepID=UPI001F03DDF9|nr:uncharacterized protein LOC124448341 [Xenia sp. Carnegie-2017]
MEIMNGGSTIVRLALFLLLTGAAHGSFESYFENYLDEMATSACAALGKEHGVYLGVRRACSKSSPNCASICRSLIGTVPGRTKHSECVDSFHVYKNQPSLAVNKHADTDVGKVGQAIKRYFSCNVKYSCGPNYCCCRAYY